MSKNIILVLKLELLCQRLFSLLSWWCKKTTVNCKIGLQHRCLKIQLCQTTESLIPLHTPERAFKTKSGYWQYHSKLSNTAGFTLHRL